MAICQLSRVKRIPRCSKVYVDNWVSKVLHEGVIYRHIILTVPLVSVNTRSPFSEAAIHIVQVRGGNG
jgi:hypothetical protein